MAFICHGSIFVLPFIPLQTLIRLHFCIYFITVILLGKTALEE